MRILLLDLDPTAQESLATAIRSLADGNVVCSFRTPEASVRQLNKRDADFDLAIIGGDDGAQLLAAYTTLAATGKLPATLIVSACASVETVVDLLKAGAEDFIVRDSEDAWIGKLPKKMAAIARRCHSQRLRNRLDTDLRDNETLLRQIIESSSVATFVINDRHEVTHWNRACEILLGRSADTAIGTRLLAREVYHHDRPILADLVLQGSSDAIIDLYYEGRYRKSAIGEGIFEVEDLFPDLPGGERWLHFTAAPLRNDDGKTIGAIETLIDITERKQAEARILESEQRLAQIIDGSAVATFVIDRDHRVTHWNQACAALTGLPASELIGTKQQWRAFYPDERPCMADLVLDGAMDERVAQYYGDKKYHRSQVVRGGFEAEDFFANFGSSGRWLYFTAAPLRDAQGEVIGAIETLQDITEQKLAEENLRRSEERYRVLSITDGMTELYNARHFAQRLREEMERAERYQHPLALMVLDVDNFKIFNDSWGHVQGDQVLICLAKCINQCLRRTDQAFRYGGEEFVALLPETDMDMAEAAAERVRVTFASSEICPVPKQAVRCTASIGVTTFIPGESPRDFVARADSGTYEAKRQGKNRVIRIPPKSGDFII